MKLAIMQPYFFPYIGYWQLIDAVDRFVIYDDVNYIQRGWINRNRVLINGEAKYLTIPLSAASQNKRICDIRLDSSEIWRKKSLKMIELAYRRSPFFNDVFPVIEQLFTDRSIYIAGYLAKIIKTLIEWLDIDTEVIDTSEKYENNNISGEERIIDICRREGADIYINAEGGKGLYSCDAFSARSIKLLFLESKPQEYAQYDNSFVPCLSIIDVMMFNSREAINKMLKNYELHDCL